MSADQIWWWSASASLSWWLCSRVALLSWRLCSHVALLSWRLCSHVAAECCSKSIRKMKWNESTDPSISQSNRSINKSPIHTLAAYSNWSIAGFDWLINWFIDQLIHQLVNQIDQQIAHTVTACNNWWITWLNWLIDWLIDWLKVWTARWCLLQPCSLKVCLQCRCRHKVWCHLYCRRALLVRTH